MKLMKSAEEERRVNVDSKLCDGVSVLSRKSPQNNLETDEARQESRHQNRETAGSVKNNI